MGPTSAEHRQARRKGGSVQRIYTIAAADPGADVPLGHLHHRRGNLAGLPAHVDSLRLRRHSGRAEACRSACKLIGSMCYFRRRRQLLNLSPKTLQQVTTDWHLKDFDQVEHKAKLGCSVRMWEQGPKVTVAFNSARNPAKAMHSAISGRSWSRRNQACF
jgi:hypothetical protein